MNKKDQINISLIVFFLSHSLTHTRQLVVSGILSERKHLTLKAFFFGPASGSEKVTGRVVLCSPENEGNGKCFHLQVFNGGSIYVYAAELLFLKI